MRRLFLHVRTTAVLCGILAGLILIPNSASASAFPGWNVVSTQNTSATQSNYLEGVGCPASNDCIAVGGYYTGTVTQTLAELWNGTSWTLAYPADASTTLPNVLYSISCASTAFCMSVGDQCTSGCGTSSAVWQTLTEEYSGSTWTIIPSVNSSAGTQNFLDVVSCPTAGFCMAVGYTCVSSCSGSLPNYSNLAESWTPGGGWVQVTAPNLGTNPFNELTGVSCASASYCWADGPSNTGAHWQTLAEEYTGTSFSVVSTPLIGTSSRLDSIDCTGVGSCSAVGGYCTPYCPNWSTLVEQWNGSSWSIITSPNVAGNSYNELFSMTCLSSSSCLAVGDTCGTAGSSCSPSSDLIMEEWNGTVWSLLPVPTPSGSLDTYGNALSCTSTTFCVLAGYGIFTHSGSNYAQTVIEQTTADFTATQPVQAGTLSFVTPPPALSFGTATLTGFDISLTATQPLDIGDSTGSGNGWSITLSNTPFTTGSHSLSSADFTAAAPAAPVCDAGATCTIATWSSNVVYPYVLPGSTGTKFISAAALTGMADQSTAVVWTAAIPANAYDGTYSSTWTLTLVSGP